MNRSMNISGLKYQNSNNNYSQNKTIESSMRVNGIEFNLKAVLQNCMN